MTLDPKLADLEDVVDAFLAKHNQIVSTMMSYPTMTDFVSDNSVRPALDRLASVFIAEFGARLVKLENVQDVDFDFGVGDQWRVFSRSCSPRLFGAVGDGVTDDQMALAAIQASANVKVVDLEGLTYLMSGQFAVGDRSYVNGVITADNGVFDFTALCAADIASEAEVQDLSPPGKIATLGVISDAVNAAIAAIPAPNVVTSIYRGRRVYEAASVHELSDLTTIIETRSRDSYVKVTLHLTYEREPYAVFKLKRNGVERASNDGFQAPHDRNGIAVVGYDSTSSYTPMSLSFSLLDETVGTDTWEYRLYCEGTRNELAINRPISENASYGARGSSWMVLEEIPVR